MTKRKGLLATMLGCLLLGGCNAVMVNTGPNRNDPIHLDAKGVERADVELDMGAGQMTVNGGASGLMEGEFTYNVDAWKPTVKNSTNGSHATVTIKESERGNGTIGGNSKNIWDLSLNDHVLTDLTINVGAGQAKLNLGTMALRSLSVQMGAGQVKLDLDGTPTHDYEAKIHGGAGQADVRLPKGVGLWVSAQGGLGSVSVTGLTKKGGHWENDLYDKSKVTVKVQVEGGVGSIKISG